MPGGATRPVAATARDGFARPREGVRATPLGAISREHHADVLVSVERFTTLQFCTRCDRSSTHSQASDVRRLLSVLVSQTQRRSRTRDCPGRRNPTCTHSQYLYMYWVKYSTSRTLCARSRRCRFWTCQVCVCASVGVSVSTAHTLMAYRRLDAAYEPYAVVRVDGSSCTASANTWNVSSRSECELAARLLGLRNTHVAVEHEVDSPPNCYYGTLDHVLKWNTNAWSHTRCDHRLACVCAAVGPPPPPSLPPSSPPPSPPPLPLPPGWVETHRVAITGWVATHHSTMLKIACALVLWLLLWVLQILHEKENNSRVAEAQRELERWKKTTGGSKMIF